MKVRENEIKWVKISSSPAAYLPSKQLVNEC